MAALNVNTIEEAKAQYDAQARWLLSQKPILARILLGTMGELRGMAPEEVEARIEGNPSVGSEPVGPGSAIRGGPTEDAVPGEGAVRYDIRTSVAVPGDAGPARVIVNVEAQRSYSPGYEIVTRGVFYASRLISSQLGVEFGHSGYDSLKKVYSIWICMNAPKSVGNAVAACHFTKENRLGSLPVRRAAYDKAEVVIVALDEDEPNENELVGMLNLALSPHIPKEDKVKGLEGRYNVTVTGDVAEGLNIMCNLSEYVFERGEKRGMERGIKRGEENKLVELALANLKRGLSHEQVAEFLGLTAEQVRDIEQKALTAA